MYVLDTRRETVRIITRNLRYSVRIAKLVSKLYIFITLTLFAMIVRTTALAIFAIVAALSLVTANSLVIQIFAQNKTGNMTKAAGNMTNATVTKTTSLGSSNPLAVNKTRMHVICHGAACHIISGCIECS